MGLYTVCLGQRSSWEGLSIQPRMWLCVHNDLTSTSIVIAFETEETAALCLLQADMTYSAINTIFPFPVSTLVKSLIH